MLHEESKGFALMNRVQVNILHREPKGFTLINRVLEINHACRSMQILATCDSIVLFIGTINRLMYINAHVMDIPKPSIRFNAA